MLAPQSRCKHGTPLFEKMSDVRMAGRASSGTPMTDCGFTFGGTLRSGFKTLCRADPRGPLSRFSCQQPGFETASTRFRDEWAVSVCVCGRSFRRGVWTWSGEGFFAGLRGALRGGRGSVLRGADGVWVRRGWWWLGRRICGGLRSRVCGGRGRPWRRGRRHGRRVARWSLFAGRRGCGAIVVIVESPVRLVTGTRPSAGA